MIVVVMMEMVRQIDPSISHMGHYNLAPALVRLRCKSPVFPV